MRTIFKTGDLVRIGFRGKEVNGAVKLASENGQSLMLEFPDHMLGGYVGMMPVLWSELAEGFLDLIDSDPVTIEAL